MAERKVIDCDKCGKECKQGYTHIDVPNGTERYFDGVESNTDYMYEKKDLCPKCVEDLLRFIFSQKRVTTKLDSIYPEPPKERTEWKRGRYIHPSAQTNDAVDLALKFFSIKEKK